MADKVGLPMPIAGAIKELVKDGRRIKTTNPPTGRKSSKPSIEPGCGLGRDVGLTSVSCRLAV
jgi:hypothetical protein